MEGSEKAIEKKKEKAIGSTRVVSFCPSFPKT